MVGILSEILEGMHHLKQDATRAAKNTGEDLGTIASATGEIAKDMGNDAAQGSAI